MTDAQTQFLNDFESVAHGFDTTLEVNIETSIGRTVAGPYAEMTVRAYTPNYPGQPQVTVAQVNGHTKAEALINLTVALRSRYAGTPALKREKHSYTAEQRSQLLSLINRGCFNRQEKTNVMLRINAYSEQEAFEKINALCLKIEQVEGQPFTVTAIVDKPAA